MDLDTILEHYLIAALWASTDDNGMPLDDNYSINDISDEAKEKSLNDIKAFIEKAGDLVVDLKSDQLGHDIFLTRNRHGAGFWDRDYEPYLSLKDEDNKEKLKAQSEEKGKKLTEIAHSLQSADFYVGDDGKIYC